RIDAKHLRDERTGRQALVDEFLRPAEQERIDEGAGLRASVGSTEASASLLARVGVVGPTLPGNNFATRCYTIRLSPLTRERLPHPRRCTGMRIWNSLPTDSPFRWTRSWGTDQGPGAAAVRPTLVAARPGPRREARGGAAAP